MNSTALVLYKQFLIEKLKSAGMIVSTITLTLTVIVALNFSSIINFFMAGNTTVIGINQPQSMHIHFENNEDLTFKEGQFSVEDISAHKVDAILELSTASDGQLVANITSEQFLGQSAMRTINDVLTFQNQQLLGQTLGLNNEQINKILHTPIEAKTTILDKNGTNKSLDERLGGQIVSYALSGVMMILTLTYAQQLLINIATEKGTKILDVLFSSVTPRQHFIAKFLANITLFFIQICIIMVAVFISIIVKSMMMVSSETISNTLNAANIPGSFIVIAILYLLGFLLLYTLLGAIFGALVTRADEAQQISYPINILLIIGFYSSMLGLTSPDAMWLKVMSYIPFFSGMTMPIRYSSTDISINEVFISLGILYITVILVGIFSIKLYEKIVFRNDTGNVFTRLMKGYRHHA